MWKLYTTLQINKHKRSTAIVLVLTILMTLIETVGISMMMPFVQVATDFNAIHENKYYQQMFDLLSLQKEQTFVLLFGGVLLLFFLFRAGYTVLYTYFVSKYSKMLYRKTVQRLFRGFISLSYREFIDRNTSRMTQLIAQEAQSSESAIRTMIIAFGNLMTIVVIYILLLVLDWKITLAFTIVLILNVGMLSLTVTKKVKEKGAERTELYRFLFKMLNETFGNFKMIKLRSTEETSIYFFNRLIQRFTHVMMTNEVLQQVPRLLLELISFSLIILIIMYWIVQYDSDISGFMGILSVFFFAMYRLMPAFNQVISGFNQMIFLKKSLDVIEENLTYSTENLGEEKLEYQSQISIEGLSFSYIKGKKVLDDISLTIKKGEHVAFIGPSGSGKSTIVDLIIGLYKPSSGSVKVDNVVVNENNVRSFRKKIGYIPQDIYLFDASVAENVALESLDKLDRSRVVDVLKQAHIYNFLKEHQEGLETIVGDRGVKLSGGQKQRIAIARALYSNPDILVLDEATSALDTETEKEIMKNIYEAGAGKTLLIIAHRLSTIEQCDTVYKLVNGRLIEERHKE